MSQQEEGQSGQELAEMRISLQETQSSNSDNENGNRDHQYVPVGIARYGSTSSESGLDSHSVDDDRFDYNFTSASRTYIHMNDSDVSENSNNEDDFVDSDTDGDSDDGDDDRDENSIEHGSHYGRNIMNRMEDNEGNVSQKREKVEEGRNPPARVHAYLPGASHPLFPEMWLSTNLNSDALDCKGISQDCTPYKDNEDTFEANDLAMCSPKNSQRHFSGNFLSHPPIICNQVSEIPILELDDVFLFPGSTLPLRLTDREWVNYLGRKIDQARNCSYPAPHPSSHASSTHDSSNNDQQQKSYLSQGVVRIGVITSLAKHRRRRRRQQDGFDYRSERIGNRNRNNNNENNARNENLQRSQVGRPMGRWRMNILRRGRIPLSTQQAVDERNSQSNHGEEEDGSTLQNQDENRSVANHFSTHQHHNPSNEQDSLLGRIGTFATITYTHEDTEETESLLRQRRNTNGNDLESMIQNGQTYSSQPEHQNQSTSSSSSRIWRRHRGQIIATALGTGRFRILSRVGDADADNMRRRNDLFVRYRSDAAGLRLYKVEDLHDKEIASPPGCVISNKRWNLTHFGEQNVTKQFEKCIDESEIDDKSSNTNQVLAEDFPSTNEKQQGSEHSVYMIKHEKVMRNLSSISYIPLVALRVVWPWALVEQIVEEIISNPFLKGLHGCLPPSSGRTQNGGKIQKNNRSSSEIKQVQVKPSTFSFWVAANMPISDDDKLDTLEMPCTIQRMRFLLHKLVEERRTMERRRVRCKSCGTSVASVKHMFTVGGADGTTGAYVNEHGVIHQTITIRKIIEGRVFCDGGPQTRDSWFPGYSWTIAYCSMCRCHLGWKFLQISESNTNQQDEIGDRPRMFWGVSGANVSTEKNSSSMHAFFQINDNEDGEVDDMSELME